MRNKRRESKEKLLKPGTGNKGRNKQQPAGRAFCWHGLADFFHNLLRVKSVRPLHWVILGREARQVEQVRVRFHRFERENLGALQQYETNTQKGEARQGKARREGWGLGRKRWRRRGALSRCYGPDLI